jgi:mevalonate kinase
LIETKQLAAQNYHYLFRVVGMNQTLKRNVVFTGSMETIPGAGSNMQSTLGGGGGGGAVRTVQDNQQAATNQQQWQLSNSRIVGTAVIDRTNQIEINAVPVAP